MDKGKIIVFSLLAFVLSGCSINYIGKYYPPTTKVDLYFSSKDIKQPYEVMGKV
jgi:hypothetical protein